MQTMADRISWIIQDSGLTKTAFAEKINVSQPFVSQLTAGTSVPSDRTIADICREFKISEAWLRTGDGDPKPILSRDEELAAFFGDVLADQSDFKRRLLTVLSKLDVEEWALIERMANKLAQEELAAHPENGQKETPASD